MQDMIDGDMDKRKVWAKVLESRQKKGLPYIFFTDNVNRNKPQVYKDSGHWKAISLVRDSLHSINSL
jgi:ribonucleoside-diphosphate reductase alpha chain